MNTDMPRRKIQSSGNLRQSFAQVRLADHTVAEGPASPTGTFRYRRRTIGFETALTKHSDHSSSADAGKHINSNNSVFSSSFPRTSSMPKNSKSARRGSSGSRSNSSSSLGRSQQRSRTPSSRRAQRKGSMGAATSIVQRSGSKHIKATLLDLVLWCSAEKKEDPGPVPQLMIALELLREHAVDSYYQVILRKHHGVETLKMVSAAFPSEEVAQLVDSTLKMLETDDGTEVSAASSSSTTTGLAASMKRPVDGMVIDVSDLSPTTVTITTLAEQNTLAEERIAPSLTGMATASGCSLDSNSSL